MSSPVDSIATPLIRGVLGALSSLGISLAVVIVPALAAQVVGTASSATALDAILIGLSVLVLGHGGGTMLSTGVIDGPVTLTPFGLLLVLLILSALAMRRIGHALRPVRDDGVLRAGALRDAGSALGMYALVYAIGLAILASIGRSSDTSPMITSALFSGLMVAVIGGLAGLLWSLRREATDSVPGVRVLDLLPTPFGAVARAVVLAVIGLLALGMATVVVLMLFSLPAQSALFDALDPGIVGGLVLTLVQLALLPLVAVWAMVVLLGGSVGLGTSTSLSLDGSVTGVLPALPMLGAVPEPGDFPTALWLLMLLPAVPVGLGAVRLVREVSELGRRDRITAWITYPLAVFVTVLLLAGLSTGGIGDGRLVHLGPQMSTLALPLSAVVVAATGLVLIALVSPLVPWVRAQVAGLRARVEKAERGETEKAPTGEAEKARDRGDRSAHSAPSAASPARSASSPARSASSPVRSTAGSARSAVSPARSAESPSADAPSPDGPASGALEKDVWGLPAPVTASSAAEPAGTASPSAAPDGTSHSAGTPDPEAQQPRQR